MRLITLFLLAAFAASTVDAASYQKGWNTIVDPIMNWWHDKPHINGSNLEPDAKLYFANLTGARLTDAHLGGANLTDGDLSGVDLGGVSSGGITGNTDRD